MKYVVSEVPEKNKEPGAPKRLWYCHMEGFPNIPVFGSIGTKKHAKSVCKKYNMGGYHGS